MVSLSLVRNKTSSPKFYLFSDALVFVQVSNSVSGCQRGGRGEVGRMLEVTRRPGVGGGKWGGCWRSPGDQGWEGGSGEDAGGHRETRGGRGEVGRMLEVTGRPGVGGRCIVMQG